MTALYIQNLTKTYGNGYNALKGINLTVEEGDFYALLGANGAGKSTTIGIITSLVNKTSGIVKILGFDLDKTPNLAKACIGLVPQEFNCNIFETSEQILINQAGYYGISSRQARPRAQELLKQLGLWDKRHTVSRMLSGGMKRRLMIARALVHQPKILILDEPTAGVDIEVRHIMWEFLTRLNKEGTTIILTTHYLEEAENLCRHVGIIDKGEMVENTTMKAILEKAKKQTLILELEHPLYNTPQTEVFSCHRLNDHELEVLLDKTISLNKFFAWLDEQGIVVKNLRTKSNRLESLFLDLIKND